MSKDELFQIDEYALRVVIKKLLVNTFKIFEKKDPSEVLQESTLFGPIGSPDISQYVSENTTLLEHRQAIGSDRARESIVRFKEMEEDYLEIED